MDVNTIVALSGIGLIIIVIGLIAIFWGARSASSDELSHRLQDFVVEPANPQSSWQAEPVIRRPELEGSFFSRTIAPVFRRIGRLLGGFTPAGTIDAIDRDLATAGRPYNLGAREFYGIRLLFMVGGVALAFLVIRQGREVINLFAAITCVFLGFYLPRIWLRRRMRQRQERIKRSLPDALDMLSVCADAGLGFDQSLQHLSESWRTPLGVEFGRAVKEMSLGISRETSLRNMASRLNVAELSSFVAIIIQSSHLGMSIAETLHAQANQMRIERRYWAQELARKVPIKMLFPLIFLILPALFIVVLGPALPALAEVFSQIGQ